MTYKEVKRILRQIEELEKQKAQVWPSRLALKECEAFFDGEENAIGIAMVDHRGGTFITIGSAILLAEWIIKNFGEAS